MLSRTVSTVPTVQTRRPHLHALTGLRFFAALYVVLFHYARYSLAQGPRWLKSFNTSGPVAVSLFFILSGLVLTYGSTDADGRCNKPARQFWYARFTRIYPLFFLAIIASIPENVALLQHTHSTSNAVVLTGLRSLLAMALLQAWIPKFAFVGNGPGWSLSVEAFFYFCFPFLVHRFRTRTLRHLLWVAIPLWLLSMAPPIVIEIVERHGGLTGAGTDSLFGLSPTPALFFERLAAQFPIARLAEFCMGICIGHYVIARSDARAAAPVSTIEATSTQRRRLGLAGLISLVPLIVLFAAIGDLRESNEIMVNSAFAAPLFAFLLVALTLGSGSFGRFLSTRTMVMLGTASYALYIIQDPFYWWFDKIVPHNSRVWWLALFIAAIIAASIACERWIERPARGRLLRLRS